MPFVVVLLFIGAIDPVLTFRHVDSSAKEAHLRIASKVCHISGLTTSSVNILHLHRSSSNDASSVGITNALAECLWQRNTPVLIYDQAAITEPVDYATFNIFIVPSGEQGPSFVQAMLQLRLDNNQHSKHEHHFVFAWPGASERQFADLFEEAWLKARTLNLLAVKASRLPTGLYEASVHTYEPFSSQGFRPVELPPNTTHFFYDKLRNMHGAPFRIAMFADFIRAIPRANSETEGYDSLDGWVAATVVRHLNATGLYVDGQYHGKCLADGRFSGAIGDVISRRTEAAFNMRYVFDCSRPYIEQLYPYRMRVYKLVVPSAREQPAYLNFVSSSTKVMGFFLVMLPGFLVMQHWVRRIYPAGELDMPRLTWIDGAMLFLRTQWGQPVLRYSRIGSLRFYLITWILYCYVLTTIYFAKLESSFVHPHYEPEADALNDLGRLNVTVYGAKEYFGFVLGSLERHKYELVMRHTKELPPMKHLRPPSLQVWRADPNAAFIMRSDKALQFRLLTYDLARNRPRFHIMREPFHKLPLAYVVDRGSPYRYKLEQIERHLQEGGLMDRWMYLSFAASLRREKPPDAVGGIGALLTKMKKPASSRAKVILDMDILKGAFYLWAGGLVAGVVAFGGELAHRRLRRVRHSCPRGVVIS